MANIIVVGAGVIGLQTAITLLEAGYSVTIVAKNLPGDTTIEYTSPWAGAIWRSHASFEEVERCAWDLESYRTWMKVLKEAPEEAAKIGLKQCRTTIFSLVLPSSPFDGFYHFKAADAIGGARRPSQLSSHGHIFDGISLNPLTYIDYLHRRTSELGASFLNLGLPVSNRLASALAPLHDIGIIISPSHTTDQDVKSPIVVNCTGLGAKDLCGDEDMFPIRGQTLLARIQPRPAEEILLRDGEDTVTYIFPRPGTELFVLGGTKDKNYDPVPTSSISADIVERCKKLLAASGQKDMQIEVVAEQVGLRPGRTGGARIEVEQVALPSGEPVKVIHHYGHAGAGYQNSIGSAKKVLRLVQEALH